MTEQKFIDLALLNADRLRDAADHRDDAHDALRAVCSNIPICCTKFYLTEWKNILRNAAQNPEAYAEVMMYTLKAEYITCPACREAEAFSKLEKCQVGTCICGWATHKRKNS